MEFRKKTSQQDSHKTPVSFHDVAACFSEEEWTLLHEWQKELYGNLMKEIQQALISLGPLIAASIFSLKPKENEDQGPIDNRNSDRRCNIDDSTSDMIANPDVLFRINRAELLHLKGPQDNQGRGRNDGLRAGFSFFNPDICLRKEVESSAGLMDNPELAGGKSINPQSGHAVVSSVVSYHIKEEENTYSMDRENRERKEGISGTSGDAHADFDVLFTSQEHKLYSEVPVDLVARENNDSTSTDNPIITSVFSLYRGHKEDMHLVEQEPQGKATGHEEHLRLDKMTKSLNLVESSGHEEQLRLDKMTKSLNLIESSGHEERLRLDKKTKGLNLLESSAKHKGPRTRKLKKKKNKKEDKRPRTAFTAEQLQRLKGEFQANRYITEQRRQTLAQELHLNEYQIKIWFQNKRAKIKKATGLKNDLDLVLMDQGLYDHSTTTVQDIEDSE